MTDLVEENRRISQQVTSMSTQLMESIERQSDLEEKLNHATRKVTTQQQDLQRYASLEKEYESLKQHSKKLEEELVASKNTLKEESKLRNEAEEMVKQLEGEVEDLTASLFAEANNMVADARKEKHTTEILNRKLLEAVKEKDNALETMQAQLKHMKKFVERMEPDSASIYSSSNQRQITTSNDSDNMSLRQTTTSTSFQSEIDNNISVIYSPTISAVRYDLNLYAEFLKFIAVLPTCKSIRDSSNNSKLLRRLNNDEILPILKIDNAPGIGLWNRKTLLNAMVDGLVVIEPISGINETYQIGYNSPSLNRQVGTNSPHLFNYPNDSPPVATHDACALCGECRSDNITHARMHMLKVQSKEDNGNVVVQNTYPLCLWCVLRVRQTCDVYAFLRSLKLGTWNLESVILKDGNLSENVSSKEPTKSSSHTKRSKRDELRSKRMSFIGGLGINTSSIRTKPQVDTGSQIQKDKPGQPGTNIERAWLQLCKLRSMLHWAHIGVWSISDSVSTKFGPVTEEEENEGIETDVNSRDISLNGTRDLEIMDDIISPGIDSALSDVNSTKGSSMNTQSQEESENDTTAGRVTIDKTKNEYNNKAEDEHKPVLLNEEKKDVADAKITNPPISSDEIIEEIGEVTKESIDIIGEYHEDADVNEQDNSIRDDTSSAAHYSDAQD